VIFRPFDNGTVFARHNILRNKLHLEGEFMHLIHYLKFIFIVLIVSCGVKEERIKNHHTQLDHINNLVGDEGIFVATLTPLNQSFSGNASGVVKVTIEGENIFVESQVLGATPGTKYFQNILTSNRCPDSSADLNNDSILDRDEAYKKSGLVILPLDSDISEQLSGLDYGPISNSSGNYIYRRSTSFSRLLSDLQMIDPDPTDQVTKLRFGTELNLENRVVIIEVSQENSLIPVRTSSSYGRIQTPVLLPYACGKFQRVRD